MFSQDGSAVGDAGAVIENLSVVSRKGKWRRPTRGAEWRTMRTPS